MILTPTIVCHTRMITRSESADAALLILQDFQQQQLRTQLAQDTRNIELAVEALRTRAETLQRLTLEDTFPVTIAISPPEQDRSLSVPVFPPSSFEPSPALAKTILVYELCQILPLPEAYFQNLRSDTRIYNITLSAANGPIGWVDQNNDTVWMAINPRNVETMLALSKTLSLLLRTDDYLREY